MANEKQTEAAGWKDRLNELEDLSGEPSFNKNAAWDTLQDRLHEKPRRKKIIWYWAAACLLPLLFWVALTINKKEMAIVKTKTATQNKTTNEVKASPNKKITAIAPAPSVPNEKTAVLVYTKQLAQPIAVQKKMVAKNEAAEKNNSTAAVETAPAIAYKSIEIPDSVISFASLPVAKKKLRVVHLNEIETPVPQFAGAPARAKSDIKILFGRTYSINPNNTAAENTGGIKIPLTN